MPKFNSSGFSYMDANSKGKALLMICISASMLISNSGY